MEYDKDRPKRDQVADHLRDRIRSGYWKIGDSVGDMFRLADEYSVSFGTIKAAETILVNEGLLSGIRAGIPTRVVAIPPTADLTPERRGAILRKLRIMHRDLGGLIAELEAPDRT